MQKIQRGRDHKERLESFRNVAKLKAQNPIQDVEINNSYLALPQYEYEETGDANRSFWQSSQQRGAIMDQI